MKFTIDNPHRSRYDTPSEQVRETHKVAALPGIFLLPYNCIPVRCKAHRSTFIATASRNAHRSDKWFHATSNGALCAFNPLRRES